MTILTYQGVVYPAQCDAMGHMNVQFYIAAFDQSLWHLMAAAGYSAAWISERRQGWADRRYEIDFRQELPVGSLFEISSSIVKVGRTSLSTHHRLTNKAGGALCAELLAVSVYFDLAARQSLSLPREIIDGATKLAE
ncbi:MULTISPECIES: acyl-CoA thioesterase [Alphaproteobacteria]|uniref:4-hydroxybenzoyl-CoA thioesterase n=2 Tax=Alphaproteobacteria TaxID=28211 RepID=A0A512HIJ6_9HYPH|nr:MULTISPECIES: acyl-CoA thioesterase [Alphaproteobacteria]GEO85277.1 4-hydroxybenzoyl-CoA thioesterase [Ciceribacter naphthalenivorans]GLR20916.1 4-hydroxybenzoyl-CoA thioesterase [Ciceribacter naphthalenivorans]GLT03772.1 4-hydroxybenzoyl-CoA thioesterase [Sphingomonas psychrolutea]